MHLFSEYWKLKQFHNTDTFYGNCETVQCHCKFRDVWWLFDVYAAVHRYYTMALDHHKFYRILWLQNARHHKDKDRIVTHSQVVDVPFH